MKIPDDLLISILSRLSIADLLNSRSVSQEFRYLSTLTATLDLRCSDEWPDYHLFSRAINTVLDFNSSPVIDECMVSVHEEAGSCIESLLQKQIKRLRVDVCRLNFSSLPVPIEIFSLASLRELVIDFLDIPDIGDFSGLKNLQALSLRMVALHRTSVLEIVSSIPSLEKLCLWEILGNSEEIRIRSASLKKLEIRMERLSVLDIYTPALLDMALDAECSQQFKIHAPQLKYLSTNLMLSDDKFGGWSMMKRESGCRRTISLLELSSGIYKVSSSGNKLEISRAVFSKLQKLSLNLNLNDTRQVVVLAFVMTKCAFLQELEIVDCQEVTHVDSVRSCIPYNETDCWSKRDLGCISEKLHQVIIKDFRAEMLELEFVRFLILNAKVLQRLEIWHQCSGARLEAFTVLLTSSNLPRASPNLRIAVHPKIKD